METQPRFASLPERRSTSGLGASLNGRAGSLPGLDTALDGGFVRFPTSGSQPAPLSCSARTASASLECSARLRRSLGKPGEREHTTGLFVTEPEGALAKGRHRPLPPDRGLPPPEPRGDSESAAATSAKRSLPMGTSP